MLPPRPELEKELELLLQETNHHRPLDSLDRVIVLSYLSAQGIDLAEGQGARTNTIQGWLEWADQFSRAG
jgi:hypothetical protein